MEQMGILAIVEAKPGREREVESFLKSAEALARDESQTVSWYAIKLDTSRFGIFDTFADAKGRDAHVGGEIARRLFASADDLLASPPSIQFVDIIANKNSTA